MTLTQLQSLARNLAFERAGETGLITDAELIEILNIANRAIYFRIATLAPDLLSEALTVATPSAVVPYTTIAASGQPIYKILAVRYGSSKATLPRLPRGADAVAFDPSTGTPQRWYVEGPNVRFAPYQTGVLASTEFVVVRTPADLVNGSDIPWGGLLPEHHDKIAILAAKLVYHKDERAQSPYDSFFQYLDQLVASQFEEPR